MRDPCTQVECYRSDFGLLKLVSLCRLQRKALGDGIAANLTTKVFQLIVHQGALLLRQLLDSGTPPDDARCMALLQIVSAARLAILPDSNKAAHHAHDLFAKAVHIDVSTAPMAAIMGLKNANLLTGAAVSEAANTRPRLQQPPSSSLTLKLLPKLSYKAFDELVHCVRTDAEMGQRAHKGTVMKTASMAQKINRLRAGQRHAVLRKRRLTGESVGDLEEKLDDVPPPVLFSPARPPPIAPLISRPTTTHNVSNFRSLHSSRENYPCRQWRSHHCQSCTTCTTATVADTTPKSCSSYTAYTSCTINFHTITCSNPHCSTSIDHPGHFSAPTSARDCAHSTNE